jgi:hypothetical protein
VGKIVTVEYIDDIDGVSVDAESVDTVEFSYRGKDYTLVLTKKNGAQFDKDVARYIRAAKKAQARDERPARTKLRPATRVATKKPVAKGKASRGNSVSPAATGPQRAQAIREWAAHNGHAVSARGRIPAAIAQAYDAAN